VLTEFILSWTGGRVDARRNEPFNFCLQHHFVYLSEAGEPGIFHHCNLAKMVLIHLLRYFLVVMFIFPSIRQGLKQALARLCALIREQ
jgi:hypothetical protein